MNSPSVLIPWRTDHGPREQAFRWAMSRWAQTGCDVVVGADDEDGPFNRSRALNRAFAASTGEIVVCMDADGIPDADALNRLDDDTPWRPVYARTEYLSEAATARVYAGADPWSFRPASTVSACTSILAVRRDVWTAIGGMDERFRGWGCEDYALRASLTRYAGAAPEGTGAYRCLWHPPADVKSEYTMDNIRLAMREYTDD